MDTLDAQLQNPLHFESPGRPVLVDRRSVNATASPPGERARLDNDDRGSSLDVGEDEEGVSPDVWGFKTGERFKTSLKEGWTIFIHHSVENVQAVLCEFTPGDPATYDVKQGVKHDFEAVKMVNRWTFASDGRMQKRHMSGNEITITQEERWFQDGVDIDSVEIAERDG
ncbi:uncharacterized protein JCM15063_001386 [Sporobolomyces koalae]|uniref:uncharacterized protein n=1 Tax=Sporobolomyces koalae TaxID=500713 RepID=UPI003173A884